MYYDHGYNSYFIQKHDALLKMVLCAIFSANAGLQLLYISEDWHK